MNSRPRRGLGHYSQAHVEFSEKRLGIGDTNVVKSNRFCQLCPLA
jgi:hypothetical protein